MSQHIKTDPKTWSSPNPTAPVIVSRVPIFAPILRVSHNSRSREERYITPWGWVKLEGPVLTQVHRAILDVAKASESASKIWDDGSMSIWFVAYKVKKALGPKYSGGEGHNRFLLRIEEMRIAKLTVFNKHNGRVRESGIISEKEYDKDKGYSPDPRRKWMIEADRTTDVSSHDPERGRRREKIKQDMKNGNGLYEIKLSSNFMKIFEEDLRVHYNPLVPEIVKIPDGTIRAIVLFFLTHERICRFSIRQALEIIGAITEHTDKADISRAMAKPEKFKAELETFGIFVEEETLRYERHPKVFFTNPPPPKSSAGGVINANPAPKNTPSGMALAGTPEDIVEPESPVNSFG